MQPGFMKHGTLALKMLGVTVGKIQIKMTAQMEHNQT